MKERQSITLTIDGNQVTVPAGTTVFDAARMQGITIPTLCHQQNETPVGVCRVCVVDVGGRVLAASCVRPAEDKMVVSTNSDKVKRSRRTLIELLMSDHPSPCARQRQSNDCELETLARLEGITQPRFPRRLSPRGQDNSSLVIAVDHEACILCDRCIRGCDEIRQNNVLGRRGKGFMHGLFGEIEIAQEAHEAGKDAARIRGIDLGDSFADIRPGVVNHARPESMENVQAFQHW